MVYALIIANLLVILVFVLGVVIYKHYVIRADKLVKELKISGKSLSEILEISRKHKLNEREVKLYYLLCFFQDFQKMGYELMTIRESAINAGWPMEMVDIVYSKLRSI